MNVFTMLIGGAALFIAGSRRTSVSGDCPDFRGGQCVYDTDHHHGFELGVRQTHRSFLPLQALEYLQQDLEDVLSFALFCLLA